MYFDFLVGVLINQSLPGCLRRFPHLFRSTLPHNPEPPTTMVEGARGGERRVPMIGDCDLNMFWAVNKGSLKLHQVPTLIFHDVSDGTFDGRPGTSVDVNIQLKVSISTFRPSRSGAKASVLREGCISFWLRRLWEGTIDDPPPCVRGQTVQTTKQGVRLHNDFEGAVVEPYLSGRRNWLETHRIVAH
jgi:hypothetical protein